MEKSIVFVCNKLEAAHVTACHGIIRATTTMRENKLCVKIKTSPKGGPVFIVLWPIAVASVWGAMINGSIGVFMSRPDEKLLREAK